MESDAVADGIAELLNRADDDNAPSAEPFNSLAHAAARLRVAMTTADRRPVLFPTTASHLIGASARAHITARIEFPKTYPLDRIAEGFAAINWLVVLWAEHQRNAEWQESVAKALRYLRRFECHCASFAAHAEIREHDADSAHAADSEAVEWMPVEWRVAA